MRRPPLTERRWGPLCLSLALLASCAGDGSRSSIGPSALAVTIASAPGEALAFEPAQVTVDAVGPVEVTFQNVSDLPHNLTFTGALSAGTRTIVSPGTTDVLSLATPVPGSYTFVCTIHEGMTGTLIVADAASR